MLVLRSSAFALFLLAACASAQAQQSPPPASAQSPYAPYEALIGEWDTGADGNIVQRFRWGPQRGYLLYSTSTIDAAGAEHLHFEGIIVYNAANRNMDFLFALEPGSLAQEHGVLRVEADGSIVRDVTLVGADGQSGHFRQTFHMTGPNAGETSLMRQNASGSWAPNFPGSDHLSMRRRAG